MGTQLLKTWIRIRVQLQSMEQQRHSLNIQHTGASLLGCKPKTYVCYLEDMGGAAARSPPGSKRTWIRIRVQFQSMEQQRHSLNIQHTGASLLGCKPKTY